MNSTINGVLKQAWKLIILVVGGTILLIGLVMVVLPGPAFIVIPVGLAILATEFAWARYWLKRVKQKINDAKDWVQGSGPQEPPKTPGQ